MKRNSKDLSFPSTKQKKKLTKPEQKTIYPLQYSIQKVNRNGKHGIGIWNNPRVPVSYRMDSGLKTVFNAYLKAKFGSTCRGIESIAVALVACAEAEVNLSTTIDIREIHVHRDIRSRRKLVGLGNYFDGQVWRHVEGQLNRHGHGKGCVCKTCEVKR